MSFPELVFLESMLNVLKDKARIQQVANVRYAQESFPLYTICLGSTAPDAPTFALIGGVHGQEKIGSQVVLSYLETITQLLHWDESIHSFLEKSKIVFLPIVNPVGMFLLRRGNANRVDIMRNSPLEKSGVTPLLGGQRFSPYIPWYRGRKGDPMEVESQALCDFIRKEVFPAKVSIALDCHSGYGTVDRLWFPYAHSLSPYPDLAEAFALRNLLDNTYPNNVYRMEPSAQGYTINGDIWDYLYEEQRNTPNQYRRFFPVTLEMGSWIWLKKNPIQLFNAMGLFHPMHLHRHKRILRRHITLLDFFHRAVISHEKWAFLSAEEKDELYKRAIDYWYYEE